MPAPETDPTVLPQHNFATMQHNFTTIQHNFSDTEEKTLEASLVLERMNMPKAVGEDEQQCFTEPIIYAGSYQFRLSVSP
jgi:hypothetical protein